MTQKKKLLKKTFKTLTDPKLSNSSVIFTFHEYKWMNEWI